MAEPSILEFHTHDVSRYCEDCGQYTVRWLTVRLGELEIATFSEDDHLGGSSIEMPEVERLLCDHLELDAQGYARMCAERAELLAGPPGPELSEEDYEDWPTDIRARMDGLFDQFLTRQGYAVTYQYTNEFVPRPKYAD